MTSSVVFGVIVVMWAVVLIPMWLRRHDETEETRSVDRFTQAMHTLSRRETAKKEKKYVVMPTRVSRARDHEVHVSGASAGGRRGPKRRQFSTATSAADRRRRTFTGLLSMVVLTLMLAIFMGGLFFIALNLVVDAGLVAFVVNSRKRARHAALIRPGRRPMARPATRHEVEYAYDSRGAYQDADQYDDYDSDEYYEPVPVKAARPTQPIFDQTALDEPELGYDGVEEHVSVAAAGGVFDQDVAAASVAAARVERPAAPKRAVAEFVFDQADEYEPVVAKSSRYDVHGRDLEIDIPFGETAEPRRAAGSSEIGARPWEPIPVPKPIYASKPAAPARPKRAPIFEPLLPPIDAATELDPVDDLEEILDRRWAVND